MNKPPSILETIIALLSIIVFLYRTIVLMYPMLMLGIKENNYSKIFNSLTLLV